MKTYYWSPFFTNIATVSAVINSAESLIKYSKDKNEYNGKYKNKLIKK